MFPDPTKQEVIVGQFLEIEATGIDDAFVDAQPLVFLKYLNGSVIHARGMHNNLKKLDYKYAKGKLYIKVSFFCLMLAIRENNAI